VVACVLKAPLDARPRSQSRTFGTTTAELLEAVVRVVVGTDEKLPFNHITDVPEPMRINALGARDFAIDSLTKRLGASTTMVWSTRSATGSRRPPRAPSPDWQGAARGRWRQTARAERGRGWAVSDYQRRARTRRVEPSPGRHAELR
jgi:hypothetical protein